MYLNDLDLTVLPFLLQRRVERALSYEPALTVLESVRRGLIDSGSAQALMETAGDLPRDVEPLDDLDNWLATHQLGALRQLNLSDISARFYNDWSLRMYANFNLEEFTEAAQTSYHRDAADVLNEDLLMLQAVAGQRRAAHKQRFHQWQSVQLPTPLQEPLTRILAEIGELVEVNASVFRAEFPVTVQQPPYRLLCGQVELQLESPELTLHHNPLISIALLERLADWLCMPSRPRDQLVADLLVPRWQRLLNQLDQALPPAFVADDKPLLGWRVDDLESAPHVRPVHCRKNKRGERYVLRLGDVSDLPPEKLVEPGDRRAFELLLGAHRGATALEQLLGHPRVFVEKSRTPTPVRRGRVSLGVRTVDGGCRLQLELDGAPLAFDTVERAIRYATGGVLVLGDETELAVCALPMETRQLLLQLKPLLGVLFPEEARPGLLERLPSLHQHAVLTTDQGVRGTRILGDARPLARLDWDGQRLQVQLLTHPAPELPALVPGEGAEMLYLTREEDTVHIVRTLPTEIQRYEELARDLGLPAAPRFQWQLDSPQESIAVLDRLQQHPSEIRTSWQGPRVRIAGRAQTSDLSLRISAGRDWFQLQGGVEVAGHSVDLAALMDAAMDHHGYVRIKDGHWLEISETLRASLTAAAAVGGRSAKLSPLHAPLLEALEEAGAEIDVPTDWRELAANARAAVDYQAPTPQGLEATLRPYQEEGFRWLASLQQWAPGACLADDMGLGKTVQALALALHGAHEGPCLVVAPTSVCFNWAREAARFAPSLRVLDYRGPNRAQLLTDLRPGDVLIATYGILTRDAEPLSEVPFSLVVLDEAQAIKNPGAGRTKAAQSLQAGFKLALSGTPVENRVAELYSLMRFVAPGLLGTPTAFSERFITPIEAQGDLARRALLARVVSPFVLRRTKRLVAQELPDRVEHLHCIAPSADERALYERHRLEALVRMESATGDNRFQVLQELQRLRQLACHPRMVDPGSPIASSKLKAVLRLLGELRESGHRALVFSSFTSHLALVREALEEASFTLRYLDGSTSIKRRQEEVDAFQDGDGDVFLISLKAGGTGLNLTAATYVIHLDPWWNPAAEDQATDRAHRIGQEQTVTVYRMVMAGTIEEQIVQLHQHKRELASALMAGSGEATRVTAEDLMTLLQEAEEEPAPIIGSPEVPLAAESSPAYEATGTPSPEPTAVGPSKRGGRGRSLPPSYRPARAPFSMFAISFVEHLDADRKAGFLGEATARNYAGAITRLREHTPKTSLTVAECDTLLGELLPRVVAGELGTKSDRTYGKPSIHRMRNWLRAPL